eukprot:CAMPEP_0197634034 /NCGR_PEP_ID=MMETSP1338-20131121/10252_1 /TAXON_ID=43686 ORGANISM="Pelagodinium beii, Strain RCC1491" /NCGR_SAMPLE_ID=MMETSP1338 /ASSEMBLY_ACC=CAM_ASM_000754 /LENGTH=287 /DNA_ID=CAMNT_0043205827 /DNA_START=59 /DNA_END=922 /DNA_ORIENTATION=+
MMGWYGEPFLLNRLKYHIIEAVLEVSSITACMYVSSIQLTPHGLFIRLLCLPLFVVVLKLCWALLLGWGYLRMKRADVPTAIRRMGCLHSRSYWSCSVAMFTCFSCLLMVWHGIIFFLMLCYQHSLRQVVAVRILMSSSLFFVVVNWLFWRDFVGNYKDVEDQGANYLRLHKLELLCKLYKTKVINIIRACEAEVEHGCGARVCTICLEEFAPTEMVAQMQCGHIFHTTCANKWLLEDWRCPFRCPVEEPRDDPKEHVQAWSAEEGEASTSIEATSRTTHDLEVEDA